MRKVVNQLIAYAMWIVDMVLAFWLAFLSRQDLLQIFAKFYQKNSWSYSHWVIVIDRVYIIIIGLAWLVFMLFVQQYLLNGQKKGKLIKNFARVTGLLFLTLFAIDLIQVWLQGIGNGNWMRWLLLAAEMTIGIGLYIYYKSPATPKTN